MIPKEDLEQLIYQFAKDVLDNEDAKVSMQCGLYDTLYAELSVAQYMNAIKAITIMDLYSQYFGEDPRINETKKAVTSLAKNLGEMFVNQLKLIQGYQNMEQEIRKLNPKKEEDK